MWQDGIPRAHGLNLSNVDIMQSYTCLETWVINCHKAPCSPYALPCYDLIWMHNCSPHLCMISVPMLTVGWQIGGIVFTSPGYWGIRTSSSYPPWCLSSPHSPHSGSRINWSNIALGADNCPVVKISQMTTDCKIPLHFKLLRVIYWWFQSKLLLQSKQGVTCERADGVFSLIRCKFCPIRSSSPAPGVAGAGSVRCEMELPELGADTSQLLGSRTMAHMRRSVGSWHENC